MNKKYVFTAEQFALQHPLLFALYQELMAATLARIEKKRKETTTAIDVEVSQVRAQHIALETANQARYAEITRTPKAALLDVQAESRTALNNTLTRLLAEKDAAQSTLDGVTQSAELQVLQNAFRATEACYRELGLHELIGPLKEKLESDIAACFKRYAELRTPAERDYQEAVSAAFDLYNSTVQKAHSAFQAEIDLPFLDCKRETRRIEASKLEALQLCAWKRDQAAQELHAWSAAVKEERFQIIDSFLQAPCAFTLREQLEAAIAEMRL